MSRRKSDTFGAGSEMSSVAYWYADGPHAAVAVPPVAKRMPVLRTSTGVWLQDPANQITTQRVAPNAEMAAMKKRRAEKQQGK